MIRTAPPGPMPESASLDTAIARAIAQLPHRRVQPVEVDGRRFWVKRCERTRLRHRLQKGNPARAFHRERAALHDLAGTALPVQALAAEGPDFLATADAGPSLQKLLRNPSVPEAERRSACFHAGVALEIGRAHV